MQGSEHRTNTLKDAVGDRFLCGPGIVDANQRDDEFRIQVWRIQLPESAACLWQDAVQNVFNAVARDSEIQSKVFRVGLAKRFIPDRAPILLPTDPGVVVEQPEVGDGIAHKQELDAFQVFRVLQVGVYFCFASLPVFNACRRLGRNKIRCKGGAAQPRQGQHERRQAQQGAGNSEPGWLHRWESYRRNKLKMLGGSRLGNAVKRSRCQPHRPRRSPAPASAPSWRDRNKKA